MTSRIRIKMGQIEVEYEGTDEFLKEEFMDMVQGVADLYQQSGGQLSNATDNNDTATASGSSAGGLSGTTNQVATKLGVSTGPDMIFAAGAKLHFVDGAGTFTRKQLLEEAKTASQHYKKSHGSNLSNHLQSLISNGQFNEPSKNTYALTQSTIASAKAKLAQ